MSKGNIMSANALFSTEPGRLESRLLSLRETTRENLRQHPVVIGILNGAPFRQLYTDYLLNVYHYATHSAIVIGMAGARAVNRSDKVAQYLLHHATEELGHQQWAMSDLVDLGLSEKQVINSRPSHSCMAMISMEYYWAAHANPVGLLGWMYTLEALGDDFGNLLASVLNANFSLQGKGTYFLKGHGAADHDHIQDITDIIINHVPAADIEEVLYVAELSATYYLGILDDIMKARVLESVDANSDAAQVSVA
jgi:pyrroloquinoline quinone (PQQ) biosynthesis protein C